MKYSSHILFVSVTLFLICLGIFLKDLAVPSGTVNAQMACNEPTFQQIAVRATHGATFTLKIDNDFTDVEEGAIKGAFRDWNERSILNCSNVTFDVDHAQIIDVEPPRQPYVLWVGYDTIANPVQVGITTISRSQVARTYLSSRIRECPPQFCEAYVRNVTRHEIGHIFGLNNASINCDGFEPGSVMCVPVTYNNITACDTQVIASIYCPSPSPTPTPTPSGTPGFCAGAANWPQFPGTGCSSGFMNVGGVCTRSPAFINNCDMFGGYDEWSCGCAGGCWDGGSCSPIVVDILGNGFDLTDALGGVDFDLDNDGVFERRGWTSINTDDAWLALDRNNDGIIDGGKELFGNATPQLPPPAGEELNGFLALAMFDSPDYGGNADGKITRRDSIFDRLRLWRDVNHNGISETCELFTLVDLGLTKIDLDYKRSRRVDQFGNEFRYRAKVRDAQDAQLGRWAWDVYLVTSP